MSIIALGNVAPRMVVDMFNLVRKGEVEKGKGIHLRLLPIARAIGSEYNFPAPVKEAIKLLGRPASPARNPFVPITEQEKDNIRQVECAGLL